MRLKYCKSLEEGYKIQMDIQTHFMGQKLTTPWLKKKKTNRQILVHKTKHRKLKS